MGGIIYLLVNVFGRKDLNKVQTDIVHAINPGKKIKELEKRLQFANTFENRVALADAYLEQGMFTEAIDRYRGSLVDMFVNDYYVLSRLQEAYFLNGQIDESLKVAERIKGENGYRKSKANYLYAQALEADGQLDSAEESYRCFDAPFNYYEQRLGPGYIFF